jgi:hypothetical protein
MRSEVARSTSLLHTVNQERLNSEPLGEAGIAHADV